MAETLAVNTPHIGEDEKKTQQFPLGCSWSTISLMQKASSKWAEDKNELIREIKQEFIQSISLRREHHFVVDSVERGEKAAGCDWLEADFRRRNGERL